MPELTPLSRRHLEILQHSLGVDEYGRIPRGFTGYTRNYFSAGVRDEPNCRALVALGLMQEHKRTGLYPDFNCSVTSAGQDAVRNQSPKPPVLSRGQRRYREWLDSGEADCGWTFGDWLKRKREHA